MCITQISFIDTLLQDTLRAPTLILSFTTNNEYKENPDSPEVNLVKVVGALNMCQTEEATQETKRFAQTLTANNQCDVKSLLLKAPHVIKVFQQLYQFQTFKDELYHPSKLVGFQQTIWGVSILISLQKN